MNILFFLTPKAQVAYLEEGFSLRQAIEKMGFHRYAVIPVLDKEGHYLHSLSEGDLLVAWKEEGGNLDETERLSIDTISPYRNIEPVKITSSMEDLTSSILESNFVPVIDDKGIFIGIITRRAIINYLLKQK